MGRIIVPAALPDYFEKNVLKRKKLLESANTENVPVLKTREAPSGWIGILGFSGRLSTAKIAIGLITYKKGYDPIVVFGWTWDDVSSFKGPSAGQNYLRDVARKGISKWDTATLSQCNSYVTNSNLPNEIKTLFKQFTQLANRKQSPAAKLTSQASDLMGRIEEMSGVKLGGQFRTNILNKTSQAQNVKNPAAVLKQIQTKAMDVVKKKSASIPGGGVLRRAATAAIPGDKVITAAIGGAKKSAAKRVTNRVSNSKSVKKATARKTQVTNRVSNKVPNSVKNSVKNIKG